MAPLLVPTGDDTRIRYLEFEKLDIPRSDFTDMRNTLTVQGALIRGDAKVALEADDQFPPRLVPKLQFPTALGHSHTEAFSKHYVRYYTSLEKTIIPGEGEWIKSHISGTNKWDGFRLNFVKTVGQGGMGIATLWDVEFEDGTSQRVVIKSNREGERTFKALPEFEWHKKYKGASHVVQPVDLNAIVFNIRRHAHKNPMVELQPISGIAFDASKLDILVLEHAEHGDVGNMMIKLSRAKTSLTNKMLWQIWECLVKGVASMAFHAELLSRDLTFDQAMTLIEDKTEDTSLDMLRTVPVSHDVHFDIEESNVLISEDRVHGHNPIFKIHDFGGHSSPMRNRWSMFTDRMYWYLRNLPKPCRPLPEQVVADWDHIRTSVMQGGGFFSGDDLVDPTKSVTAGRYGTWSNVFRIGRIMESVITRIHTLHPFTSVAYTTLSRPSPRMMDTYCLLLGAVPNKFTEEYDPELRDEITQCQAKSPADRPSVISLLDTVLKRKARGFEETDAETATRWKQLWAELPDPVAAGRDIPGSGRYGGGRGRGRGRERGAEDATLAIRTPRTTPQGVAVGGDKMDESEDSDDSDDSDRIELSYGNEDDDNSESESPNDEQMQSFPPLSCLPMSGVIHFEQQPAAPWPPAGRPSGTIPDFSFLPPPGAPVAPSFPAVPSFKPHVGKRLEFPSPANSPYGIKKRRSDGGAIALAVPRATGATGTRRPAAIRKLKSVLSKEARKAKKEQKRKAQILEFIMRGGVDGARV